MKNIQMRTSRLFRACCPKESATITCLWQGGEWESFMVEKIEGLRYALIGGCWQGEAGCGLPRRRASDGISLEMSIGNI